MFRSACWAASAAGPAPLIAAVGCCASIHMRVVMRVSPAAFALALAAASDRCAASDSSARDLSDEKKPPPPLLELGVAVAAAVGDVTTLPLPPPLPPPLRADGDFA